MKTTNLLMDSDLEDSEEPPGRICGAWGLYFFQTYGWATWPVDLSGSHFVSTSLPPRICPES
jgi:hypothetical protein